MQSDKFAGLSPAQRYFCGLPETINAFLDIQNMTKRVNIEGRLYEDDFESFEETEELPHFPAFGLTFTPSDYSIRPNTRAPKKSAPRDWTFPTITGARYAAPRALARLLSICVV